MKIDKIPEDILNNNNKINFNINWALLKPIKLVLKTSKSFLLNFNKIKTDSIKHLLI